MAKLNKAQRAALVRSLQGNQKMRTTIQHLESQADALNDAMNTDFSINQSMGGVSLVANNGSTDVLNVGHVPKKALSGMLAAMLTGAYYMEQTPFAGEGGPLNEYEIRAIQGR